ncbi:MAG: hypothetical protein Q7T04_00675 [Dehalococcoidia bacterium]|nr:hypothetical protein [Dehalococcoidia bacterium]
MVWVAWFVGLTVGVLCGLRIGIDEGRRRQHITEVERRIRQCQATTAPDWPTKQEVDRGR